MRGARIRKCLLLLLRRIIPAYAGSTFGDGLTGVGLWDHPRVCGEHGLGAAVGWRGGGSSPRMRGARHGHAQGGDGLGIIPAYAGSTGLIYPGETLN